MTHYERRGSGRVLIMLHGWADTLQTFNLLLAELGESYDIVRLDLPGFGATQAPGEVWNLDAYAQFVASFLQKIDVSDYVLVGHSNGGAVAIRGVGAGVLKPQKLVLLASSGVRDTGSTRRMLIKVVAKVGKLLTFWLPKSTRQKLQKRLYGTIGSDMLIAPQLKETFKQTVRQDIQQDATKINVPTLLIYGDQDKATPVAVVGLRLKEHIKDSHLEVLSDADHFVHQAQSAEVARLMKEFLG